MPEITFKGNPIHTAGSLPKVGATAPDFKVVKTDLSVVSLREFKGKRVVLNIFPSIDTPVCALSTKKFNEYARDHEDAVMLMISADLPFAQGRFCNSERLANVVTLSAMRNRDFAQDYGVLIEDGPLAGLMARAIVVLDENDTVAYKALVPEIGQEPDYQAALKALG